MNKPIGQDPAFQQAWEALQRQLETVLAYANQYAPNKTLTAEAVNIAQHFMQKIADQLNGTTPEG